MPEALSGIGAGPGAAAGPVARLAAPPQLPAKAPPVTDPDEDLAAARAALTDVADDLGARAAWVSGEAAEVLATQAMLARDPGLDDAVAEAVRAGRAAPWAVREALAGFQEALRNAGGYLAERAADLADIGDRAVAVLLGVPMPGLPAPGHPYVLVARDLSPADTATLDPAAVLAIVTEHGGPTSHTAILARALGLPAVVNCAGAGALADGVQVAVDGGTGKVTVDPSSDYVEQLLADEQARREAVAQARGPGRTADGHPVKLLLNVGSALADVADVDAEGIGLFRTEFLYLDSPTAPTVDQQRAAYQRLFDGFAGRKVVVRTLDAGADKPLAFLPHGDEPNPALGVRGYRTSRAAPELLEQQLAAIAQAAKASDADVWVMAPMVSTPAEAGAFVDLAHSYGLPNAGVMIEVPAAALRAGELMSRVDFVSIGTNDLSQYAFAADRMLGDLGDLLDPWQPALLELIATVARAGQATGTPVSVCGEAAADPQLAVVLTGLGVTSLSMSAPAVPAVRAALAQRTLAECQQAAARVLAAADPAQARAAAAD